MYGNINPRLVAHLLFTLAGAAVAALCLQGLTGCAPVKPVTEKAYRIAPTRLPAVRPEMKTPGYWISRIDAPDRVILDDQGIRLLNQDIRERLDLTKDIACLPDTFEGREVRGDIRYWLGRFRDRGRLFASDGRPAGKKFYADLERKTDLPAVPDRVSVKWGLVTAITDQRLLPTQAPLYKVAGDIDFDRLQNNSLDLATPVAVLHRSADAQWFWVAGPASDGWVRADQVALCSRDTVRDLKSPPFVTVVGNRTGLYWDRHLTRFAGFARMGTRLMNRPRPGSNRTSSKMAGPPRPGPVPVLLPVRGKTGRLEFRIAYIKAGNAVQGDLPYTPRHIVEQAFEMLDAPYGWGGSLGRQDCSQFLQSVFSTVGIRLPRNSAAQGRVGRDLLTFGPADTAPGRRAALVSSGLPGVSILYSKGHVMLYLGDVSGRPYAIHALWGYRDPGINGDRIRVTNRVVVTDLELGKGTARGTFLQQVKTLRGVF